MSYMFAGAGASATTWEVIIPKTNGLSINNTPNSMYRRTSSIVADPPSGRSFTLVTS